ncbi:MAG: ribosome-binding factor A [Bacillota bacterium]
MKEHRDEKAASELRDLAGEFIAREAGRSTLITPTRVEFGNSPKHATIYVSVFPHQEMEHALSFLERNASEFRDYIKKHGRFSILPFVKFVEDSGEQNRQRLDELSKEL